MNSCFQILALWASPWTNTFAVSVVQLVPRDHSSPPMHTLLNSTTPLLSVCGTGCMLSLASPPLQITHWVVSLEPAQINPAGGTLHGLFWLLFCFGSCSFRLQWPSKIVFISYLTYLYCLNELCLTATSAKADCVCKWAKSAGQTTVTSSCSQRLCLTSHPPCPASDLLTVDSCLVWTSSPFVFQSSYLSSRGRPDWWKSQVFTKLWIVVRAPENLRWATFLFISHQTHNCRDIYAVALQSIHSLTHRLTPNHVGDTSLSGSEDPKLLDALPLLLVILLIYKKSCNTFISPQYLQPISLPLFWLSGSRSYWLPLSSLACTLSPFHSFICPLHIFILSLSFLISNALVLIDLLSCSLHLSGGFSETYAALCDYNGIGCKEEVQWVRTLFRL